MRSSGKSLLRAVSNKKDVTKAILVASTNAHTGWDKMDIPAPPISPGEYTSIYFPHTEWNKPINRYEIDARPVLEDGEIWSMEVASNSDEMITLHFEDVRKVPDEYQVLLINKKTHWTQNLRTDSTYLFPALSEGESMAI